jgi:hypothetical protein
LCSHQNGERCGGGEVKLNEESRTLLRVLSSIRATLEDLSDQISNEDAKECLEEARQSLLQAMLRLKEDEC